MVAESLPVGSPWIVAFLAILIAVELGLLIWALVDLARRPAAQVAGGNRLIWLLLCLLVQLVGPILYLAVGRVRVGATTETTEHGHTPTAADTLAAERLSWAAAPLYDTADGARGGSANPAAAVGSVAANGVPGRAALGAAARSRAAGGAAVELSAVRKVFGQTAALDGLSLSVPEGSVFGFLGPNGAGKTTTLRILAGLCLLYTSPSPRDRS